MLLVSAALFISLWIVLAGARPALASCTTSTGPCTAAVGLGDGRFDLHIVSFNGSSSSDSTADTPVSVQRMWRFEMFDNGPATISGSWNATSPLTFFYPVNPGPPPPPFSASGTLAPGQTLLNQPQQQDYALDTQTPGFSSSRSVSPLVIPTGGATQTLTLTFTVDDGSFNQPVRILVVDPGVGSTWQLTSSSDPANTATTTIMPPTPQSYPIPATPSSAVQVYVNATVGTTYTLTYTGFVPNSGGTAFTFKPQVLFEAPVVNDLPVVYGSTYSLCDTVLNAGPCTSTNNVTFTLDQAYELHPAVEHKSLVGYQGGQRFQNGTGAALTPGYWKNHLTSGTPNTSQFLPQTIGPYTVSTTSQVTAIFNAMNCANSSSQNAIGCLAGQDLATLLNAANGSDACITAALMNANAWLSGVTEDGVPGITYTGPTSTYTLTSAQRTEALSLMTALSMYNATGQC
jgi:hypothetical protein